MTLATAIPDDAKLLRRYLDERSEEAFRELVHRYLDLVYTTALRQVGGNAANAADVSQSVFIELARQSSRLISHPTLTGWIYTATLRMAAHYVRDEIRRQRRAQEAHVQYLLQCEAAEVELDWSRLRPVLDHAMMALGEIDRLAVLLRHFERRPLAEVGACLGLSDNAARMRVDRALDKLRGHLAECGITSAASALTLALGGPAMAAAPAGLATGITAASLAALETVSTMSILPFMSFTNAKLLAVAVFAGFLGTGFWMQQRYLARIRQQNAQTAENLKAANSELATLRTALVTTSNQLVQAVTVPDEVLTLRGEVARLRRDAQRSIPEIQSDFGTRASGRLPAGETLEVLGPIEGLERTKRLMDVYGLEAAVAREKMQRIETDLQVPQEVVDSGRLPEPSSPELQKRLQPYFEVRLEFDALQRKRDGLMLRFAQEAFDQADSLDEKGRGKTLTDWYGLQAANAREKLQRLEIDLQVPQEVVDSGLFPESSSPELRKRLQPYFEVKKEADTFHRILDGLRLRAMHGQLERPAQTGLSQGNTPQVNP